MIGMAPQIAAYGAAAAEPHLPPGSLLPWFQNNFLLTIALIELAL